MVKKSQQDPSGGERQSASSPFAETVKESAQQIWLAGLGAFSKAQEEGGKVFESLVKEGVSLQRKTQAAAEDKLAEASHRMASMATEVSSRASGQWDKLESLFEDRVARAMGRMGMPSATEIERLSARVDELQRTVARLQGSRGAGGAARKTAAKAAPASPARKTARKRAPARKSAG